MKYGLIGTCYNTGISHIAQAFAQKFNMKTLLADYKPFAKFPERFPNYRLTQKISQSDIDWLLDSIDILFTIETPYEWQIYSQARAKGIKVILMPMIEWLDRRRPELRFVDLFICPSSCTYDSLPGVNKVLVPCEVPVDLEKFKPRNVKKITTFLHNSGHGGIAGRNSTKELLQAIRLIKNPNLKFIIRSQFKLPAWDGDTRVTFIEGNVINYWDLYEQGDVWIMPWKYGVGALGLQESMGAGMLPVITEMPPFNEFMPKELLIAPKELKKHIIFAGQSETWADQEPVLIAEKIEQLANLSESDVKKLSAWAKKTAKAWSWDVWLPKYQEIFENLKN